MELLQRSCRELEQTVIVVTHDPRAAAYARRVIFLRDGQVVREYTPGDEILLPDRISGIMATMQALES
jgi:putative ABC transport system ATP-binding protein